MWVSASYLLQILFGGLDLQLRHKNCTGVAGEVLELALVLPLLARKPLPRVHTGGAALALRGFATAFVLVPLVMILFLIPNTLTWGIRRIIVGGNGFFPWQVLKKIGERPKT